MIGGGVLLPGSRLSAAVFPSPPEPLASYCPAFSRVYFVTVLDLTSCFFCAHILASQFLDVSVEPLAMIALVDGASIV